MNLTALVLGNKKQAEAFSESTSLEEQGVQREWILAAATILCRSGRVLRQESVGLVYNLSTKQLEP